MNNLTSFIYFMDVVDNVRTLAAILCVASVVAALGLIIWFLVLGFNPTERDIVASRPFFYKCMAIWVLISTFGWIGIIFTPSRNTMMLMAGSEVGERIVKSDQVQGIVNPGMDLLKAWIKSETDRLAKNK